MTDIFAIGGAHIDRRAFLKAPHQIHTSNPARVFEEVGGGMFNAARAIRSAGLNVSLLSARGGDLSANTIEAAIKDSNITDKSSVYLDRTSPSYTAMIGHDGELITAFADMDLYEFAIARALKRSHIAADLQATKSVLIDANIASETLVHIAEMVPKKPIFAMAISASKVGRMRAVLGELYVLYMNKYEAEALSKVSAEKPRDMIKALRQQGLIRGIITNGGKTLWAFEHDHIIELMPPQPSKIVDVTGAGDALAGTVTAHILRGAAFEDAIKLGMRAASYVITQKGCAPVIDQTLLSKPL